MIPPALAAEANMLAAMSVWAGAAEGGVIERYDGAIFARCAAPLRSFNNIVITDSTGNLPQLVADARRFFVPSDGRFRLRVRDDVPPVDDETFANCGLVRRGGIPSLAVPLPQTPQGDVPVEIRQVTDATTLTDHTRVVAAGFEWDADVLSRVFRRTLPAAAAWRGFVGYVDGEAAGASQLVINNGVAGIYYVATTESMRRRGIGDAMTRHALGIGAANGCTIGSLQASPMGRPIYERMGFEVVAQYRTYVRAEA
jgi:ribosomal protein S18 acetylase RimI-like enzyme